MGKTVAIIGAGAAGLCALKHLSAQPDYTLVGFERYEFLGGIWVYTDRVGKDLDGLPVHTSMYKNLRTNIPKDVMKFPDFPFSQSLPSFPSHTDVLAYLHQYADHFHVRQYIKFGTVVTNVEPVTPGQTETKWTVTYSSVTSPQVKSVLTCDAVLVCNGHYYRPYVPDVPGADQFLGSIVHAHNYRMPEQYRNKTVVICGVGSSGQDLCSDVATVADKVYFSHKASANDLYLANKNVFHKPIIQRLTPRTVVFSEGEELYIDSIIYCTGYKYDFPFLSKSCEVTLQEEGRVVTPLYKHMIHTKYPSLLFIGLLQFAPSFPLFDVQMRLVLKLLDGVVKLPSTELMNKETEEDVKAHNAEGLSGHHFHYLIHDTFAYFDDLDDLTGSPRIPAGLRQLFYHTVKTRRQDFTTYKCYNYEMSADSFNILP